MKRGRYPQKSRQGSTLVLSLIFLVMLSALATAMAAMSGSNVQIADNHRKFENTRGCAESGLEVIRYWMSRTAISGTTAPGQRFAVVASELADVLSDAGITNITPVYSGSTITISNVPLNSGEGQSFSAVLTKIDDNTIRLDVTGQYGTLSRTLRSEYTFTTRANTVFDFGVATKGPLSLTGNVEFDGYTIAIESNTYIDCDSQPVLSIVGNCDIGGEVSIRHSDPDLYLTGNYGIGGDHGAAALEHIHKGTAPSDFPEMDPTLFFPYATRVLLPTDPTSGNLAYENLRIPAGRNPSFSGNLILKGVIYIETPNVVTFSGNLNITGIIVTAGDVADNSAENQIKFTGNITCQPITALPQQPQFEGLHDQTGTFLLAPGFKASFGGNFGTLAGAIAANGLRFYGNAGGVINGSLINYSDAPMELTGNSDLRFNRSGLTEIPAGFVPKIILGYDPSSYSEVVL